MSDWAAKVLADVPRHNAQDAKSMTGYAAAVWLHEDAVVDAIAKLAEGDGLVERIAEPHDPGGFVGDIYFGHPVKTTMGTHRWTGSEWVKLPSEAEALAGLLADARSERDALRAQVAELTRERDEATAGMFEWVKKAEKDAARLSAITAQNQTWQRNSRETFDAMVAMRNSINEHLPMPSLESDLLQGPENSVFCAAVAEAVVSEVSRLHAKVARLEGALTDMPKAVLRTTICQGPQWPDDRPGVWLAALEACAKSVQTAVNAAIPAATRPVQDDAASRRRKIMGHMDDRAAADARAEALLKRAAQMAYEVWDDPEALAKAILALIPETKP